MYGDHIVRQFERIGARAVASITPLRARAAVRLNVLHDGAGEVFTVQAAPGAEVRVVDARPDMRHLLLLGTNANDPKRFRFLCGHDERHWFVAAVPGERGVSNVRTAMEALKPGGVLHEQARRNVSGRDGILRRNRAYIRQGEWFFVPRPDFSTDPRFILRNEPIRRGSGKPHMVDEVFRTGGELVYVNHVHPNGIPDREYRLLVAANPREKRNGWRIMRRNASVMARGRVRHQDHETITLPFWHEVLMNTENQAPGMEMVAFLD